VTAPHLVQPRPRRGASFGEQSGIWKLIGEIKKEDHTVNDFGVNGNTG